MNLLQPITLYGILVILAFYIRLFKSIDEFVNVIPPRTFKQYLKTYIWKTLGSVATIVALFILTWYEIPETITVEGIMAAFTIGYAPDVAISKFMPRSMEGKP